jgi:hypothetical protein
VARTTAVPTTAVATTIATTAASGGVVTPEVVCVAGGGVASRDPEAIAAEDPALAYIAAMMPLYDNPRVYFGYSNSGATAVVVDDPARNVVEGGDPYDTALAPTVLAPGQVRPAFYALVPEDGSDMPRWTLTGPDGVARTARADGSSPECTPDLLERLTTDTRTPTVTFSTDVSLDPASTGDFALVAATVAGLGPSVCPPGLEPRAPLLWSGFSEDGLSSGTLSSRAFLYKVTDPASGAPYLAGPARVAPAVIDVCSGGGAQTRGWSLSSSLERFQATGRWACVRIVDGRSSLTVDDMCEAEDVYTGVPATGGIRVRSPAGV